MVCGVIKNLRWWYGSQPPQPPAMVLLNFTGKTETDLDSFCTKTRGFREQVEVVYQKGKKKEEKASSYDSVCEKFALRFKGDKSRMSPSFENTIFIAIVVNSQLEVSTLP